MSNDNLKNELQITSEVIFCTPPIIHQNIYNSWIDGYNIQQTSVYLHRKIINKRKKEEENRNSMDSWKTSEEVHLKLLQSQIISQFRFFDKMKYLLNDPQTFETSPLTYNIPPSIKRIMIEKYFSFDEIIMREIIGRKLNPKMRKELEEIKEKTKKSLSSCQRQFENILKISKEIREEENSKIDVPLFIKKEFLLSETTTNRYCRILFLCHFQMDTIKKRLKDISFEDYEFYSQQMIRFWTDSKDIFKITLDFHQFKDLKNILSTKEKLEELKSVVLNPKSFKSYDLLSKNFIPLFKALLNVACNLQKDISDFFADIIDEFIDPFAKLKIKEDESRQFFQNLSVGLSKIKKLNNYSQNWENFIHVVSSLSGNLYIKSL